MVKDITYLIEELVNFNPAEYADDDDIIIDREDIDDVLDTPNPETLDELKEIVAKRLKNNPKKPYLEDIDTHKITTMAGLFSNIKSVFSNIDELPNIKINAESIVTINPKYLMSQDCIEIIYGNQFFDTYGIKSDDIEELDLSNWDTSNVNDMSLMFNECRSLTKLNISSFNTKNVISMYSMFADCDLIESLDLSHFKLNSTKNLMTMFWYCRSLKTLNISTWNTSKVINMNGLFYSCISLVDVDFSNFVLNPETITNNMFYRVPKKTIEKFNKQYILKSKYQVLNKIKDVYKKYKKNIFEELDSYNFDISEYNEDPNDLVDHNIIDNSLKGYELVNNTNILWSDLNVYTLEEVINDIPQDGYPIGINIIDNKFVSLKYMSYDDPAVGSITPNDITFSNKNCNTSPAIKLHKNNKFIGNIRNLEIEIQYNNSNAYYNSINKKDMINKFKYFNGKKQTALILDDIKDWDDYPTASCVSDFSPGDTNPGDWYIPEIGELVYIIIQRPVIEYICKVLMDKGYNDIYHRIFDTWYCSSTFYSTGLVYNMRINNYYDTDYVLYYFDKQSETAALAMYQLPTL